MLLADALRTHGRALIATAACVLWSGASLAAFLLARHDWTILTVWAASAALLFVIPAVRQYAKVLAIVGGGVLGGLLALEVGLRLNLFGIDALTHPSHYGAYSALLETGVVSPIDDAQLGFGLTPNYDGYVMGAPFRTSAQGFRTRPFAAEAAPATSRVLVFGASIAMGAGVTEDHTYAASLERSLSARLGQPVEALDLGVPAYSVPKIFHLAKTMAPQLRPRLVTVELPVGALNATRDEAATPVGRRAPLPISTVERYSFAASALYPPSNLRDRLSAPFARFSAAGRSAGAATPHATAPTPGSVLEDELRQLTTLGRSQGFSVVVLLVRPMSAFAEPNLDAAARQKVRAICERQGAILVDTYPLFQPGELADDFIIFPGDLHPNAVAHARFATAIADATEPILRAPAR